MQFQIGDQVVHPLYGVDTVKTFSRQRFAGPQSRNYYEVSNEVVTVWVPINEQGSTVLRGIASKESLKWCRRLLKRQPVPLDGNHQMRQLEIASRLRGRLLHSLCRMTRDLRAASRQKPLGITDSKLLRKTFKAFYDEWAASDGVSAQAALDEIESLLRAAEPTQTSETTV